MHSDSQPTDENKEEGRANPFSAYSSLAEAYSSAGSYAHRRMHSISVPVRSNDYKDYKVFDWKKEQSAEEEDISTSTNIQSKIGTDSSLDFLQNAANDRLKNMFLKNQDGRRKKLGNIAIQITDEDEEDEEKDMLNDSLDNSLDSSYSFEEYNTNINTRRRATITMDNLSFPQRYLESELTKTELQEGKRHKSNIDFDIVIQPPSSPSISENLNPLSSPEQSPEEKKRTEHIRRKSNFLMIKKEELDSEIRFIHRSLDFPIDNNTKSSFSSSRNKIPRRTKSSGNLTGIAINVIEDTEQKQKQKKNEEFFPKSLDQAMEMLQSHEKETSLALQKQGDSYKISPLPKLMISPNSAHHTHDINEEMKDIPNYQEAINLLENEELFNNNNSDSITVTTKNISKEDMIINDNLIEEYKDKANSFIHSKNSAHDAFKIQSFTETIGQARAKLEEFSHYKNYTKKKLIDELATLEAILEHINLRLSTQELKNFVPETPITLNELQQSMITLEEEEVSYNRILLSELNRQIRIEQMNVQHESRAKKLILWAEEQLDILSSKKPIFDTESNNKNKKIFEDFMNLVIASNAEKEIVNKTNIPELISLGKLLEKDHYEFITQVVSRERDVLQLFTKFDERINFYKENYTEQGHVSKVNSHILFLETEHFTKCKQISDWILNKKTKTLLNMNKKISDKHDAETQLALLNHLETEINQSDKKLLDTIGNIPKEMTNSLIEMNVIKIKRNDLEIRNNNKNNNDININVDEIDEEGKKRIEKLIQSENILKTQFIDLNQLLLKRKSKIEEYLNRIKITEKITNRLSIPTVAHQMKIRNKTPSKPLLTPRTPRNRAKNQSQFSKLQIDVPAIKINTSENKNENIPCTSSLVKTPRNNNNDFRPKSSSVLKRTDKPLLIPQLSLPLNSNNLDLRSHLRPTPPTPRKSKIEPQPFVRHCHTETARNVASERKIQNEKLKQRVQAQRMASLTPRPKQKLSSKYLLLFNTVVKRNFHEQAIYFLNAFWNEIGNESEYIYTVLYEHIKTTDMRFRGIEFWHQYNEGRDLDFDGCLYFFEQLIKFSQNTKNKHWKTNYPKSQPKEMTAIARKKEFREKVDVNFNGRASFLELLLYQYNCSPKLLIERCERGTIPKEVEVAMAKLDEVNNAMKKHESKKKRLQDISNKRKGTAALKAKAELAQLSSDNIFNKALTTSEASVRIASRLHGLKAPTNGSQPKGIVSYDGTMWWMNKELEEKKKFCL